MTEKEYFAEIQDRTDKINKLITERDVQRLYNLCHDELTQVMSEESALLNIALTVSEVSSSEQGYLKKTTLDLAGDGDKISPIEQLDNICRAVSRYLLRIDNHLDEDNVIEGLSYFAEKEISGDLIIRIAINKTQNTEHVLAVTAGALEEASTVTALRLYKYLQEEYKKPEYFIKAALVYMTMGNREVAVKLLEKIENKTDEVQQMISRLKTLD